MTRLAPQRPRPARKWMTCLGCYTPMHTDAGHRKCPKCLHRERLTPVSPRVAHPVPAALRVEIELRDDWRER